MRVATGRGNDSQKILRFYRVNYGICAPFRILCDGPLIHRALQKRIYFRDSLSTLLGASALPVVTRCIVEELRALGEDFSGAALFAKRLTRIPCAHDSNCISAADCVISVLRNGNARKFVLATCDNTVLRAVSNEHGVPLIRLVNDSRIVLLPPNNVTIADVKEKERQKSDALGSGDAKLLALEEERKQAANDERNLLRSRKKKRARGPNPLSVMKPKFKRGDLTNGDATNKSPCASEQTVAISETACTISEDSAHLPHDGYVQRKPKRIRKRKPKVLTANFTLPDANAPREQAMNNQML